MSENASEDNKNKPEVLIVDDSKVIRKAASKMLGSDYVVHEAADGDEGWRQLEDNKGISVIFSDIQMPVMNGMELLAKIRNSDSERISGIPVIMITGAEDSEKAKQDVFEIGATDFITKPFASIDLQSRARSYAQLNRRVNELEKQAGYDKLTGLYNANSYEDQGDKALSFALRHKLNISTAYIEIEGFQDLFLRFGKSVAQQIIIAVSKRMSKVLRAEDIAARVGVARFAVLLPLTNNTHARLVVCRIREVINKLVFDTGKGQVRLELLIGLTSPVVTPDLLFSELMAQSDVALKRAMKKEGEKIASYYDEEHDDDKGSVVALKHDITDEDLIEIFKRILAGDYHNLETTQIEGLVDRLAPFLDHVDAQSESFAGTNRNN